MILTCDPGLIDHAFCLFAHGQYSLHRIYVADDSRYEQYRRLKTFFERTLHFCGAGAKIKAYIEAPAFSMRSSSSHSLAENVGVIKTALGSVGIDHETILIQTWKKYTLNKLKKQYGEIKKTTPAEKRRYALTVGTAYGQKIADHNEADAFMMAKAIQERG